MVTLVKRAILGQYEAGLAMMKECVRKCPAEEWDGKIAVYPFWQAVYHTLIEAEGTLGLSTEERVHFARPSIDVLFRTAAEAYRERCVGIVLTGANDDGADGLRRIKELGGVAIVQDPGTAERREMPAAAIAATDADVVLPLGKIGTFLRGLLLETRTRNPA